MANDPILTNGFAFGPVESVSCLTPKCAPNNRLVRVGEHCEFCGVQAPTPVDLSVLNCPNPACLKGRFNIVEAVHFYSEHGLSKHCRQCGCELTPDISIDFRELLIPTIFGKPATADSPEQHELVQVLMSILVIRQVIMNNTTRKLTYAEAILRIKETPGTLMTLDEFKKALTSACQHPAFVLGITGPDISTHDSEDVFPNNPIPSGSQYYANLTGKGAIAQGPGAVAAAGTGDVVIGGHRSVIGSNSTGNIITGNNNFVVTVDGNVQGLAIGPGAQVVQTFGSGRSASKEPLLPAGIQTAVRQAHIRFVAYQHQLINHPDIQQKAQLEEAFNILEAAHAAFVLYDKKGVEKPQEIENDVIEGFQTGLFYLIRTAIEDPSVLPKEVRDFIDFYLYQWLTWFLRVSEGAGSIRNHKIYGDIYKQTVRRTMNWIVSFLDPTKQILHTQREQFTAMAEQIASLDGLCTNYIDEPAKQILSQINVI